MLELPVPLQLAGGGSAFRVMTVVVSRVIINPMKCVPAVNSVPVVLVRGTLAKVDSRVSKGTQPHQTLLNQC